MGPQWLPSIIDYYETNDLVMISSPVAYFEEKNLLSGCKRLSFHT